MSITTSHARVIGALGHCIELIGDAEHAHTTRPEVSAWSVAEHIEHLALADAGMLRWLERVADGTLEPSERGDPKPFGLEVLATGRIPRGKGEAPRRTVPERRSLDDITSMLRDTRSRFRALEPELPALEAADASRPHPLLGHYTAAQWVRFAEVHHDHHHAIIQDILT